jgi:hypothetical protein
VYRGPELHMDTTQLQRQHSESNLLGLSLLAPVQKNIPTISELGFSALNQTKATKAINAINLILP